MPNDKTLSENVADWMARDASTTGASAPGVSLETKIAGEDLTNNWLAGNAKGYLVVKGGYLSLSGASAASGNLGVNAELISIYNATAVGIWVRLGTTATVPGGALANSATPSNNATFYVPANGSITVPYYSAAAAAQVSVIGASSVTGYVYVMAAGNS